MDSQKSKDKADRIARLKKVRKDLIKTYSDEKDPNLRKSFFDIIGNLVAREKLIMDGRA